MTAVAAIAEKKSTHSHAAELEADLEFLARVIRARFEIHSGRSTSFPSFRERQKASPAASGPYADFVDGLTFEEHVVLLMTLVPHIRPGFFDEIMAETMPQGGDFPQIGGTRGKQFRGFLPTAETALFILAGDDLAKRFAIQHLFSEDHDFARRRVLRVERPPAGEPATSGLLTMDPEFVDLFTLGRVSRPRFSLEFPAHLLTTEMTWDDLILPKATQRQIRDVHAWIKHGELLLADRNMRKRLKRGYRVLFHGPPGTGKTLTASLLGKFTNRPVYRVDLSMIVSKYVGETEKNLANLFDKADDKSWILFFDEADALFGKRTNVRDAHDKYANQEVAYLLQRVETYSGLVILASNFKSNIDEAFMRRFQAVVHFPAPRVFEREKLWRLALPESMRLADEIQLDQIARKYELTGAHIMNVVQFACLRALDRDDHCIYSSDLDTGVQYEFGKYGKVL